MPKRSGLPTGHCFVGQVARNEPAENADDEKKKVVAIQVYLPPLRYPMGQRRQSSIDHGCEAQMQERPPYNESDLS